MALWLLFIIIFMSSSNNNAKFAFFYLLSLVGLIFVSIGTGQAIFQVIHKLLPDPGIYRGAFNSSSLTFAISALIISLPLYFLTVRYLSRCLREGSLDGNSPIRRWLTYLILFISAVVFIVWLMITISGLFDGELTLKFILKSLTVFVIAGLIFGYYFYDIRRSSFKKGNKVVLAYLIGGLVISIGSLILAFFFADSPKEARERKQDQAVLNSFMELDNAIVDYYLRYEKMPERLEEVLKTSTHLSSRTLRNPSTDQPFNYEVIDERSYELCAEFNRSNKEDSDEFGLNYADRWPHEEGYYCITQSVPPTDLKALPQEIPMR